MGYEDALNLAAERLAQIPPETVCQACGARYEGGEFFLPWLNTERPFSAASDTHKILWFHYLTANGAKQPSGRMIPQELIETGKVLGGQAAVYGDASVTINVLPYLPMTFIIWAGSEEFLPDGNILFDQTAKTWFAAEDLAGAAVYELIAIPVG